MSVDYSTWTMKFLKEELSRRGARTTGRKEELVTRLQHYDLNDDFRGAAPVVVPEMIPMPLWPKEGFLTITDKDKEAMPMISEPQIRQYIIYRQVSGREINNDITSMKKGEKMFNENAVLAMSYLVVGNVVYCSGIVSAEMKKNVTYNIKFITSRAGDIHNSHCECPSGAGPHSTCKHIVAALLVISSFAEKGDLRVAKSCTDTLQSFKRPSGLHSRDPVLAEELGRGARDDDDPRPPEFRNRPSYVDELHMATINYSYASGVDVSWRYAIPKADLQTAMKDHDYLDVPFCEN